MENNTEETKPRQAKPAGKKRKSSMPDYEADLRHSAFDMGTENGKASVRLQKTAGDDMAKTVQKPGSSFFTDLAKRYEAKLNKYIKFLKDLAVKGGTKPDALKDVATMENYSAVVSDKIVSLEANEFHGKNLVLYIVFAFLLCLGDILLGDYLAKEVLLAGASAPLKGILLGLFCIALGVILEVIINNLYNRANKKAFNTIITIIPLFTLFMFVGMGVLRSMSVKAQTDATSFSTSPPGWTITTFFVGMSLAAPTALGCVLFIIQKKLMLNRHIRRMKLVLEKVGVIINTERLLEKNKSSFAQDLMAEYDIGFQKGRNEELFRAPEPEKEPEPKPLPAGSLQNNLKEKMLRKYFNSLLLIAAASSLLFACTPGSHESAGFKSESASSIVFMDVSKEKASKILEAKTEHLEDGTAFSVIWPGGVEACEVDLVPGSSLMAARAVVQQIKDSNSKVLSALRQTFARLYQKTVDTITRSWRESSFSLLAVVSEQFYGRPAEKKLDFWIGRLPHELLAMPDSAIKVQARADALKYGKLYTLQLNQLSGTGLNIYVPAADFEDPNYARLLRCTLLYYREAMNALGIVVLSAKTITV
jgi:hypothetical protein